MNFRAAWLTGSRVVRNGTVYSRQGQNRLRNKISGCRYRATEAPVSLLTDVHAQIAVGLSGGSYIAAKKSFQKEDELFEETIYVIEEDTIQEQDQKAPDDIRNKQQDQKAPDDIRNKQSRNNTNSTGNNLEQEQ